MHRIKRLMTGVIVLVGLTLFAILLNSDTKAMKTTPIFTENSTRMLLHNMTRATNFTGYGHRSEFKQQLLKWNNLLLKQLDKRASKSIRWVKEFKNESFPLKQNVLDMHQQLNISKFGTSSLVFENLQLQHRNRTQASPAAVVITDLKLFDVYESFTNATKYIFDSNSNGLSSERLKRIVAPEYYRCHISQRVKDLGYFANFSGGMVTSECVQWNPGYGHPACVDTPLKWTPAVRLFWFPHRHP